MNSKQECYYLHKRSAAAVAKVVGNKSAVGGDVSCSLVTERVRLPEGIQADALAGLCAFDSQDCSGTTAAVVIE